MIQKLQYGWRLVATAIAFSLFGIGGLLIPPIAMPVLYLLSRDRAERQRYARRLVHFSFRFFANTMRVLGIMTWEREGFERLNAEHGRLLLANHPTLIDVVLLVAFIPRANCIVKGRLLANPAMRGLITLAGYITNDEGGNLIAASAASLARGDVLVVFPEGTRSRVGQPLRFQRGAANVAIRTQQPVTPVFIDCQPATLSKQHKWYHIPERRFHMTFRVQEDIPVQPFLNAPLSIAARNLNSHLEHYFRQGTQ